jgi:hypothetical protein
MGTVIIFVILTVISLVLIIFVQIPNLIKHKHFVFWVCIGFQLGTLVMTSMFLGKALHLLSLE